MPPAVVADTSYLTSSSRARPHVRAQGRCGCDKTRACHGAIATLSAYRIRRETLVSCEWEAAMIPSTSVTSTITRSARDNGIPFKEIAMYQVPPVPADSKLRYVEVTDSLEKEAVENGGFHDPIGHFDKDGRCWAERE